MIEGFGSVSIPRTNGSGSVSRKPKNIRIRRIRIRNTAYNLPTIAIHNEGDEDHLDDEARVVAINQDVSQDGPGLEPNVQKDERSLPLHVGVHHLAAPPALQQAQDPALREQCRVEKFCYAAAALIHRLRATMHAHFKAHCFHNSFPVF